MVKLFDRIFSKDISNTKRQIEVDIARGLAVFFMLLVHINSEFLNESANNTLFARIIDFLGTIPAAPVFMFVMGIGFVYSKKQDPVRLFKRGLLILAGGYLLNIFRGFLPLLIGVHLDYYPLEQEGMPWYFYLVEIDILQFAGLAMIFIAFLKAIKLKEIYYPILAIIIGIVSPFVWGIGTGHAFPDVLIALFFGGKNYVFHPFFSWIFYPLMGAFFGWLLIRVADKNKFYLLAISLSLIVMVAGLTYFFLHPGLDFGIVVGNIFNYFHHGILSNLVFCSFIVLWLAIWHFIAPFIIPKFFMNRLLFWSKSVTVIYVVHWLIIGWCEFLIFDNFTIRQTILAMFVLIVLTDRITFIYNKIVERLKNRDEQSVTSVTAL